MRAVVSILGLVIVFAIVLNIAKKQMQAVAPAAPAASARVSPAQLPREVQRDVQRSVDDAARRASEAQP